jgi:hypothetical protein
MEISLVSDQQPLVALLRALPDGSEVEIAFDFGEGLRKKRRCRAIGEPGIGRRFLDLDSAEEFWLDGKESTNGHVFNEWIVGIRVLKIPDWGQIF